MSSGSASSTLELKLTSYIDTVSGGQTEKIGHVQIFKYEIIRTCLLVLVVIH